MPNKPEPKQGLRKNGTSKRTRAGKGGRDQGTSPIIIGALVVAIIGAALLFWPKGGSDLTGIGEQQSVVTIPDSAATISQISEDGTPRSGDVDIDNQDQNLVPEKPEGEEKQQAVKKVVPPKTNPKPKTQNISKPATAKVLPQTEGRWAVQTGGFGDAVNADKEAARLLTSGWQSFVRAGSNSQGKMVYRVWIGYFESRDVANAFIQQNKNDLADAYVVHR